MRCEFLYNAIIFYVRYLILYIPVCSFLLLSVPVCSFLFPSVSLCLNFAYKILISLPLIFISGFLKCLNFIYRKVASRSTCYQSGNLVFWGATNQDMSLNETCLYSQNANFELLKSQLLACPTLYYGVISCFKTSFPVLERNFSVLECPFLFKNFLFPDLGRPFPDCKLILRSKKIQNGIQMGNP